MKERNKNILTGIGVTALALLASVGLYSRIVNKQSLSTSIVNRFLENQGMKEKTHAMTEDLEKTHEELTWENRKMVQHPFSHSFNKVRSYLYKGMQVFAWNEKAQKDQAVIFYLHGGGYILQPNDYQFLSLNGIAKKTSAKVIMPIYPKAPEYNYEDAFPLLISLYEEILEDRPASQVHFLGDSAGGGLALGLSYLIEEKGLDQAANLILLSPWLDLTNSHPNLEEANEREVFFDLKSLKVAAASWGGEDRENYYVSPKFGDPRKIKSKISIFTGTHETFYYDIMDFVEVLDRLNIDYDFELGQGQLHVYPFYPTIEGAQARDKIAQMINRTKKEYGE